MRLQYLKLAWIYGCISLWAVIIQGESSPKTIAPEIVENQKVVAIKPALTLEDTLVLGVVQGLTEYAPVSSTAHLIIAAHALGLELSEYSEHSTRLLVSPIAVHTRAALNTYLVIIQLGSILAVFFIYWQYIVEMLKGLVGKSPFGQALLKNLTVALIPSALLGLLLEGLVERYLRNIPSIIGALCIGALAMWMVQRSYLKARKYQFESVNKDVSEITGLNAFFIGCAQAISLWPGMSRSMTTLLAGYRIGLSPLAAAQFSFLLGFVTLSVASAYKCVHQGSELLEYLGWQIPLIGIGVAFIVSFICIKGLLNYLARGTLNLFIIYRILLAGILVAVYYK